MKPVVIAPRAALDLKPAHGAPCTRCGLCCIATLCDLAQSVFNRGPEGPCPALGGGIGTATCGLVNASPDQTWRDAALLLIGAADGCDARFNGEPVNREFNARMAEQDRRNEKARSAARRQWGMV